jgi:hypothetical protein
MKIEILGTGCKKCKELYQRTLEAGLMSTPGLRIDGKVVSYGKVPKVDEIRNFLK